MLSIFISRHGALVLPKPVTTKKDLKAAQLKDLQTKLDSLNQQIAQVCHSRNFFTKQII